MRKWISVWLHRLQPKRLTQNLGLKAIALLIAFLIWVFVTNSDNPVRTQLFSVPVTIVNEDSFAAVDKVVDIQGNGVVTVKVRERRSVISQLARTGSDFYVEADLENITEMNTVPLTISCGNAAVTWDEMEISPSSLKVTLEDKTEQTFAASVAASGTPATGFAVGTTEILQGKNIIIAGPQSLIGIIGQVTAPVSVAGMQADGSLSSTLRVYDKNGSEFSENQMKRLEFKDSNGTLLSEHAVEVYVTLWEVHSDVRVRVETAGTPAFGYRLLKVETLPETITLAGTAQAFEQIQDVLLADEIISVEGASENVTAEIDLTETVASNSELKFLADADPVVSATAVLEKSGDVVVTIPISEVEMENRPDKMRLVFTPADLLSVTVHAVDDMSLPPDGIEGIRARLDLSDCAQEGTYELPVEIELPEGLELSSGVVIKVSASPAESEPQSEGREEETQR